jgi:hypothetical protein
MAQARLSRDHLHADKSLSQDLISAKFGEPCRRTLQIWSGKKSASDFRAKHPANAIAQNRALAQKSAAWRSTQNKAPNSYMIEIAI